LEDFVSSSHRTVIVAFLSVAFVATPALASPASAPSAPIGVVLQAGSAKTGLDVAYDGATIYDGDRLQTTENSTLRVRLGGPQMILNPGTTAQVHSLPKGFSADLTAGTVVVSAEAGQTFQVLADGAAIRPVGAGPTAGQITRINASEVVLTGTRGMMEVSMGAEVRTVEPGHSYRMEVETEASPADPAAPQGPYATAHNGFIWIVIAGVSAATAVGIWRALVSPNGL